MPVLFNTARQGDSSIIQALGERPLSGETWLDSQKVAITLSHIYYIPGTIGHIFSTGSIERNGYSLFQGDGHMCIFDKLPDGTVKHGFTIHIKGCKILEAQYNPSSNCYWTIIELHNGKHIHLNVHKFKTWHHHFGHVGKDVLHNLPKHTKEVDAIDPADEELCDGCTLGKSTCNPFPPSEKHATEVLE